MLQVKQDHQSLRIIMPIEYNPDTGEVEFILKGVLFSKVIKQKVKEGSNERMRERVTSILPELTPLNVSRGSTSSKISVPIPNQPELRMRMGFQGPTLTLVVYLHTYEVWKENYIDYYNQLCQCNWYNKWKWGVNVEDLIKVSDTNDTGTDEDTERHISVFDANPANHGYGVPFACDLDDLLQTSGKFSSYSTLLSIRPGTYWWVRKKEITREAGWADKFKMELTLERSWQWSTTGKTRPAFDIDVMDCFKDGATGYDKITKEYTGDS